MEQAIKIAIENGWKNGTIDTIKQIDNYTYLFDNRKYGFPNSRWSVFEIVLQKDFWQALGKGLGWADGDVEIEGKYHLGWYRYWHRFIDHLSEGKDIESFFKDLTK